MKFYMCVFCAVVCMSSLLGLIFFFYLKMFRRNHPLDSSSEICLLSVLVMAFKNTHTFF